ncbi:MAG: GNAT family N-acetyltransferase [Caldilineaceae bacterium]
MSEEKRTKHLPDILYYRAMESHDAFTVGHLTTTVFCEAVITHFDAEGIADMLHYFSPENYVWRLHNGYFTLVAELNDKMVGMIEVRLDNHITLLFVDSTAQGRGIGRKLIELAIRESSARHPELREMTVHATPNAVGFYRTVGFQPLSGEHHERGMRFWPMVLQIDQFHANKEE